MINHSVSFSPQREQDCMRRMYVRIGTQKYAADGVEAMERHPGFPGNQNILSKYSLSAWIPEINRSFVFPEMAIVSHLSGRDLTYCACRVEYFKHALLPVDLHLLRQRE